MIRKEAYKWRPEKKAMAKRKSHELVGFLAIWAVQYQKDYGLDGLHPGHYDLMKKYGARMDSFTRATNAHGENASKP